MSIHNRSFPSGSFVIMSAHISGLHLAENLARNVTLKAIALRHDAGARFLCGCYRDEVETSILIGHAAYLALIADPAARELLSSQESVLVLGPQEGHSGLRPASLRAPLTLSLIADLGWMHRATPAECRDVDAWTFDPIQRQHFICAPAADRLLGETIAQAVARWRAPLKGWAEVRKEGAR